MMADKIDKRARSKDSAETKEYLEQVEILLRGQSAVREAGETFLPKMPNETDKQYAFRLKHAKLTNIYRDTTETLTSKPFEEEIALVDGSPEQILEFIENVDGDGNNLTVFAASLFFQGVNDAISWVLIDYPKKDENIKTLADAKRAKVRPFWSIVLQKNILEIKADRENADAIINYVRILEPGDSRADDQVREFKRVGSIVTWELWQEKDGAGWISIDGGTLSIEQIPLVPFITGRRDGKRFVFLPPLQDAFETQKTLYNQESNLEYAKIMTAFPMLSASGVTPERDVNNQPKPVNVGPQTVLYAPRNGDGQVGKWEYVEPTAASLKFLADDVKETKQDLRELGKQPLTAQAGLTVITTAYAAGKSKSAVRAWGLGLKDTLENCLMITCRWLALDFEPEVIVYDDYDNLSNEDFDSVLEMRKSGDVSQKTVWAEAKRRGILAAEFNDEMELANLLKETPADITDDGEFEKENPNET